MFHRIITMLFLIISILSVYFIYKLSLCNKRFRSYKKPGLENYSNYYNNKANNNNGNTNTNISSQLQNNTYPVLYNNRNCATNSLTPKYRKKLNPVLPYIKPDNDPRYNNINYVIYDTNPDALPPYPDAAQPVSLENYVSNPSCSDKSCDDGKCTQSVYINNDGKIASVEQIKNKVVPVVPLSDPYKENKIVAPVDDMVPYDSSYGDAVVYTVPEKQNEQKCPTCTPIPLEILEYANKHLDNIKNKNKNKKKCVKKQNVGVRVIPIQKYIVDNDGDCNQSSCCQ